MLIKQRARALPTRAAPACVVARGVACGLCGTERVLSSPRPRAGKVLTSSLLRVVSAVCFGLLYPLSHPARYVTADQVGSFQHTGLSATSPSARRPRQGDAARRGSASPASARLRPPPALEAEGCVFPKHQTGTPVLAPHLLQATLQPPSNKLRP